MNNFIFKNFNLNQNVYIHSDIAIYFYNGLATTEALNNDLSCLNFLKAFRK